MKKFAALTAVLATTAAVPATAGAKAHHRSYAPTTGLVCQPPGVAAAKGWAIQYDEATLRAERFVRPFASGARLAPGYCMRFVNGRASAFVASPFAA